MFKAVLIVRPSLYSLQEMTGHERLRPFAFVLDIGPIAHIPLGHLADRVLDILEPRPHFEPEALPAVNTKTDMCPI